MGEVEWRWWPAHCAELLSATICTYMESALCAILSISEIYITHQAYSPSCLDDPVGLQCRSAGRDGAS